MGKYLLLAAFAAALVGVTILMSKQPFANPVNQGPSISPTKPYEKFNYETRTLKVKDKQITVLIADSGAKRSLGLSFRDHLDADQGMLFIMGSTSKPNFWMKDMLIPLDIIWIREGQIVDISVNLQPPSHQTDIQYAQPKEAADQVLEVNAGFVYKNNIRLGDTITKIK